MGVRVPLQGVAQQDGGAVSVVLGTRAGEAQAQLEGFKSRALRGEVPLRAQRQVYTAEWRVLDSQQVAGAALVVGTVNVQLGLDCLCAI